MAVARLSSIVLDCDDPAGLARFWVGLVGGDVAVTGDQYVAVRTSRGWIAAMQVPDHRPPTWGKAAVPKQMHMDCRSTTLTRPKLRPSVWEHDWSPTNQLRTDIEFS